MKNIVSVVVPLYNYKRYIEENICSIMNQTYPHWEIIIVDDCSDDNPYDAIEPYLGEHIRYIRLEENMGYSCAKNAGIRSSVGSMIVVLDADDMLTPKSLQYRVEYLESNKKAWVHGKVFEFHDNIKPYEFNFVKRKAYKKFKKIQNS